MTIGVFLSNNYFFFFGLRRAQPSSAKSGMSPLRGEVSG